MAMNEEELECERHFSSTHSRDAKGRYIVRLPLKSNPASLGESRSKALSCLGRLFKRFSSDTNFRRLYVDFIEEYRNMGHMTEADASSDPTPVNYLFHHGVLRQNNRTTKLRVVFNGSSRTSSGLSLNDILPAGAKLQTDMCDILLWTRSFKVLFSADIVKMFRQIVVYPDDWDLQRILWYGKDNRLLAYRFTTVTYGLSCAPFLALRTLQQLVSDEGHRYPKAIDPMTKGRYVDDIFGGADSPSEARDILTQVIRLFDAGGFPLQKWSSNYPELLPNPGKEAPTDVEIEPTLTKILGLVWRPCSDTLHFLPSISDNPTFTKRAIYYIQERWSAFRQQLLQLEPLFIPRWIGIVRSDIRKIEIHGFSDASQLAMAAAVYVKVLRNDTGFVQLMCSKTRVAPLKRLTIPRLELTVALLLARLIARSTKALELPEAPVFCWSDSSVTLTWVSTHPSHWKDFVQNRVSAIQEILSNRSWRFVPGKENPADLASRGLRPDQLIHHELWWKGPKWLSNSQAFWPSTDFRPAPGSNLEERPGMLW